MDVYRIRRSSTTNAATAVDVPAPQLKPGQIVRVRFLALYNNSGEVVTAQFGIIAMGSFTPIDALQSVSNGQALTADHGFYLGEEDTLIARVTGVALSGQVIFLASGELLSADADPPPPKGSSYD